MKKFKFVGAPGEKLHREDIVHSAFGLDFAGGYAVEVSDKSIIKKLSNNSHYEETDDKTSPKSKPPSQMSKKELVQYAIDHSVDVDQSGTNGEMLAEIKANIKAKEKE